MTRILLLEDDEQVRVELEELLDSEGYQVHAAATGAAAIELAGEHRFDLIVADVKMEGMDGLTALSQLRQADPGLAALVISGYSDEADTLRALRLGAGDFLKKPFRVAELLSAVETLLERRRRQLAQDERDRAARALARWAVTSLARSSELGSSRTGLLEAAALAGKAARLQGLEPSEDVELLTLVWGLEGDYPEFFLAGLSDPVRDWLIELSQERPTSLAAGLALAALGQSAPNEAVEALEQARREAEPPRSSGRQRRDLLSLGQTLELAGDLAGASQAYAELVAHAPGSLEAPEASLRCATLLMRQGQLEPARRQLAQAWQAARRIGPSWTARVGFEVAVLLHHLGDPEAVAVLEEASGKTQEPGISLRSRLFASVCLQPEPPRALELLGQLAQHPQELYSCAGWLFPWLLQAAPEHPLLERLARNCPGALLRLLRAGKLPLQARRRAGELLERLGGDSFQEAQKILLADPELSGWAAGLASVAAAGPTLRLLTLGRFELALGDRPVPPNAFRSQKVRFLLACLAANRGRPLSEDMLIETFWGDFAETGKQRIYAATTNLRAILRAAHPEPIVRERNGIQLAPELVLWHDLEEVEQALAEPESVESLGRVARLYAGPYLESCYSDWAVMRRERLEQRVGQALTRLAELLLARGQVEEALEQAHHSLELDRCHQEAHLLIMQAHLSARRPEEAIRQYESCCQTLRKELAMEPSIALMEAYQRARLSLT